MAKIVLCITVIILAGFTLESQGGSTEGFEELKQCVGAITSDLLMHAIPPNFEEEATSSEQQELLQKYSAEFDQVANRHEHCYDLFQELEGKLTDDERQELNKLFPESFEDRK